MLDTRSLLLDIKMAVAAEPSYAARLKAKGDPNDPRWSVSDDRLLLHDGRIFVPESKDLHLRVLQTRHDHQLAGHLGQSKTYHVVSQLLSRN